MPLSLRRFFSRPLDSKKSQAKRQFRKSLRSESLEERRLLAADVQQTIFEDNFESGQLNSTWSFVAGTPTVMSESDAGGPINAWGNRALNLDSGSFFVPVNDSVITRGVDLTSFAKAQLKYRVQAEGRGDEPEAGDDLLVQYTAGNNVWQTIRRNTNADTNNASFNTRFFDVPASALQGIAFRFLNLGDPATSLSNPTPRDDWFIDDVKLTAWRPHVTISDATVTEGNSANFLVKLVNDAGNPISVTAPVTVTYAVEVSGTGDDAASAADFSPRTGSVTFTPGETTKSITVATSQDTIDELTETFRVRLTGSGARAEITDSQGVGTIVDNDPAPAVTLGIAGQPVGAAGQVPEGDSITFEVKLDRASSRTVTVNYASSFDSATADDLAAVSGTLSFAPGETSKQITVSTLQDNLDEPDESFSLQVFLPSNALLTQFDTATVSIVDDDATPSISISSTSGTEGDAAATPLVFAVSLSNPSSSPITVDYATLSQTALAGDDYVETAGTLTFAPGAVSQSFSVGLIPDDKDESASEQFAVNLSNPGNAVVDVGQGIGTILDDDASPVPVLDLAIYRVDEGPGGLLPELQIDASGTSDADSSGLTYRWDIGNDGQIDRVSTKPVATFSYSELAVLGLDDGPLQSQIRLEVSDGINVNESLADLVVENSAPYFVVANDSVQLAPEAGGLLREWITIEDLSLSETHTITVDYGDGTALDSITLAPGERSAVLEHVYTSAGTYQVDIVVSDGYAPDSTFGSFSVAVALGSSLPVVAFDSAGQAINEGDDWSQITATLSSPSIEPVTVPLIFTGDTQGGFTLSEYSFEFEPGQTQSSIEIYAFADGLFEPTEQLRILMGTPTSAQLGLQSSHVVSIVNIDPAPNVEFANVLTTLPEGAVGTLTAALDFPSASDVVIPLSLSGSATETNYENFSFSGNEIIIPAGALAASKTLLIQDDELAEAAQSLQVSMGLPIGALPGANQVATFLIPANDTPVVDFRAAALRVDEASGTTNVVVDLTNPIAQKLLVPFTVSGTATNGSDFTFSPEAPLEFQPGQTSAAIDLTVIDDLLVEVGDLESVVIRFGQPNVGILGNTAAFELLIADNDFQTIQFVLDRQTIDEDSGSVTFDLVSNRIADSDISIPLSFVFDSIDPSDLSGELPAEVILPAGASQTSFTIPIRNDVFNEPNESFTVHLGAPSGGGELGEKDFQQITIADDDPIAFVSVEEKSFNEVTRGIDFLFQLSAPTNKDAVLNFTSFGNASLGTDYTLSHPGTIRIPAGQSSGRVTAFIRNDAAVEADESLGLRLTEASNAVIQSGIDRASLTIQNNDVATVRFTTAASNFDEGEAFRVKVSLSKALAEDVTIPVKSIGGSRAAKPGIDYVLFGLGRFDTVTIPAGRREASFSVVIRDDRFIEGREAINLQLGQPSNELVELDATLLKLYINSSDKPLLESVTINPGGLGLNEPGTIVLDADEVPGAGNDLAYVLETPDGEAIQVPPADVQKMIQAGQINVITEGSTTSNPSAGQSTTLAISSGTLNLEPNGLSFSSIDLSQVAPLSQLGDLSSAPVNVAPMTLIVDTGNGNFAGSTVFFDTNFNGIADFFDSNGDGVQQIGEPSEPTATTYLDGSVDLQLSSEFDFNGDGRIDAQDGRLVLQGGFDTATELPMPLQMQAAVGHYSLSPLSTLAAKLVYDFGFSSASAEFRTLTSFGIEGANFSDRFVVQAAAVGDQSAARMAVVNAQLQSTAIAIGNLISGLTGTPALVSLGDLVYSDMADKIRSGNAVLDLSSEITVESIIRGIEFQTGVSPTENVRSAAIQAIAGVNHRLGALDQTSTDFLQQRAKIEVVAIGQLAPALQAMSAGSATASEFLTAFTGAAFEAKVAVAEYGIITPPKVSVSSYKTLETDTAGLLRFEVQIEGEITRPVEVTYETVLDDAVSDEVTPVSGTLTWQPGDNTTRIIEVPFTGDTQFEEDESVLLALTGVANAVLKNDLGVGFILNDDELRFSASTDSSGNAIDLSVDADEAQLMQNDAYVLGGFFSEGAVTEIHGAAGVMDHLQVEMGADNSFLNGGLAFVGNGDLGESLSINAPSAGSIVHQRNIDGTGIIEIDGQTIAYSGVHQASHSSETRIVGLPNVLNEGASILLNAELPTDYPASNVTYSWSQTLNGVVVATGNAREFLMELPNSGSLAVSLQVSAPGYPTTTQILSLAVENLAPIITVDLEPVSIVEGTLVSRSIQVSDVVADDIDVSASIGTVSTTESGDWIWSFRGEDDLSPTTVTILAEDSDGGQGIAQFDLSVENAEPELVLDTTDISVTEGNVVTRTIVAQDVSSDSVTLAASFGTLTPSGTGEWVWAYEPDDDHSTQQVVFVATDDDQGVSTASINVVALNQPPTLSFDDANVALAEGAQVSKPISAEDVSADTILVSASLGTITVVDGNNWVWSYQAADDLPSTTVLIRARDEDGGLRERSFHLSVDNVVPSFSDYAFEIAENSPLNTEVGHVDAEDPGADTLTYQIVAGNEHGTFSIDSSTGQISVQDPARLDYEVPEFRVSNLTVRVADDDGGEVEGNVRIDLLNQASLSGTVFVDSNANGAYDANETGVDGVTIELLDSTGSPVLDANDEAITAITSSGGFYLFDDLSPGIYRIFERQPANFIDGAERLGSEGGVIVDNDTMQLKLARANATDYSFAEFGSSIGSGEAAAIGFWQNRHGQALMTQGGAQLASWLTDNFGNIFGSTFAGASGADVARFYRDELFKQKGKKSNGPAKVDAHFMATALSVFFTSRTLASDVATGYGFRVTDEGLGSRTFNVGANGVAFDVENHTAVTVRELLLATNRATQARSSQQFSFIFDRNGDGKIDEGEKALRVMANDVFSSINELGSA